MKFLVILTILISSILAKEIPEEWKPIDFSQVVRIEDTPGFPKIIQQQAPSTSNRRIQGGQEVQPNSHPYQVAVFIEINPTSSTLCGGTILNTRAILTAAHCLVHAVRVTVVAGAHNIHVIESTQQRRTAESASFRIHPGWNPATIADDVGIVIVPTPFTMNAYVTPTRLPFGFENESFVGEWSRVIGWGITGDNTGSSPVLREAFNTVITNQECINAWGSSVIRPAVLCTATIGQGACSSDSGGSLTVPRAGDSRPVQIGIVSFGAPCGVNSPSGFGRVTSYLDWIVANQNP